MPLRTVRTPASQTRPASGTGAARATPQPTSSTTTTTPPAGDARARPDGRVIGVEAHRPSTTDAPQSGGVLGFRLRGFRKAPAGGVRDAIRRFFSPEQGRKGVGVAMAGVTLATVAFGASGCATAPSVPASTKSETSTSRVDHRPVQTTEEAVADVLPGVTLKKKPLPDVKDVRPLEEDLRTLGLRPGRVDDEFTQKSFAAVKKFQRRHDMEPTGVPGPRVRAAIDRAADAVEVKQTLARFDRVGPGADYHVRTVDGELINQRTKVMFDRATYIMQHVYGHAGFDFAIVQGSYSNGVSASGGTHDRGGALDVHTWSHSKETVDHMVKALRTAGFAAWSRGRGYDSFDPHIHAIAIGDAQLAPAARAQVGDYFAGRSGLVGGAPDPDRHLGRDVPEWAKRFA